jgi:hypothetical protein
MIEGLVTLPARCPQAVTFDVAALPKGEGHWLAFWRDSDDCFRSTGATWPQLLT